LDPSLVQLITEMVMAELGRGEVSSEGKPSPVDPAPGRRKLLLVPAPPGVVAKDPLWASLRGLSDVSWSAVKVDGVCPKRVEEALGRVHWVDPPATWDDLVHSVQAVVLPVFRLEVITRIALLLGDVPASGAAIAAVMQGIPVFANASEVERLRRSSGRLPGPFLSTFHQHLRGVEGLGVQVLEGEALVRRLSTAQVTVGVASTAHKGRDVITVSDLEAAAASGQKYLQVTPGAIITPLAREKAAQMQIEVRFS